MTFGSYVESSTSTTRATQTGVAGNISTAERLQQVGFGVFGFYTDNQEYDGTTKPNFFWNQQVTYSDGWTYTPTKYWPNEYGSNATSSEKDLVSFFAYAPFCSTSSGTTADNETTTGNTCGITAFSSNAVAGDPYILYTTNPDATLSQDLLWGVAYDGSKHLDANGDSVIPTVGLPNLNLSRQRTTDVVRFRFKHALYRLGLTVSSNIDTNSNDSTLVLIKEIKLTGNFPESGKLNLNNTSPNSPLWQDLGYNQSGSKTTLIDITTDRMNSAIADVDYGSDKSLWKERLGQGGVNSTAKSVLPVLTIDDATENSCFTMIPDTTLSSMSLQVSLTYTVQTVDAGLILSNGYSRQEHTLTGEVELSNFEEGMSYQLNLLFDLNAMTFTVASETWKEPITFSPDVEDWKDQDGGTLDF